MTSEHRRWTKATVAAVDEVAPGIRRVELKLAQPARADPGAHLDVEVSIDGRPDIRSYSVVECDPDANTLVLTIARATPGRGGSAYMHGLAPGDSLPVTLPLQTFPLLYGRSRYVLVAGGIGITALHAMARRLRERGEDYRFVYAGRSRDVMAYLDALIEEHGELLRAHTDDEHGLLDVAELVEHCDASTVLYMCGPKGMMDAISAAWGAADLPAVNLRFETFGNSGRYAPEEFVVRVPRLGIETKVPSDSTMLDALEAAGAEVMYDCRRGECGLCEVRILDVAGVVDHRDVFLSERQWRQGQTLCACVTRVARTDRALARVDIDIP
jgi:vanillate O-demethylase ferredoxin subunit